MSQWTPENPGVGDTETLVRIARRFEDISSTCSQWATLITGAIDARADCWSGEAAEAWEATVRPGIDEAGAAALTLTTIATAMRRYHREVKEIHRRVRLNSKFRNRILTLAQEDDIRCTVRALYRGTSCTANSDALVPELEDGYGRKKALAADYTTSLRSLDSELDELGDRRRTADRTLREALANATGSAWSAKKTLSTAIGITDTSQLTDERIGTAMAAYADDAVHGSSDDLSDEELRTFTAFYAAYGNNESVLSVFYTALGGDKTRLVMQQLENRTASGNADAGFLTDTLLPVARQVRDGLARASRHWSRARSQRFADSLFNCHSESESYESVSAFLFDGATPFGAHLARAFANSLDTSERVFGRRPPPGSAPFGDIDRESYLLGCDRNLRGQDLTFRPDVASGVMTQLSRHPDEAVAFFAAGERKRDDDKMQYWLGERPWPDGLAAATSLIACFQHARGGMTSPPKKQVPSVLIVTTSLVGDSLSGLDTEYGDTPISESARTNVAKILALNLYDLQSTTFMSGTAPNADYRLDQRDEQGNVAYSRLHISSRIFTNWVGRVQRSLGGIAILQRAANLIEVNAAIMNDTDPGKIAAVTSAARMRGYIDAGRPQADMREAEVSDDEYRKARDLSLTVLGLIPWTAALPLAGPIDLAAGVGVSLGLGALSDQLSPHSLEDAEKRARENFPICEADETYRLVIIAVNSGISPSAPPPGFAAGRPAEITDAQRDWAAREWPRVSAAYDRRHPGATSLGAIMAIWKDAAAAQLESAHGGRG